MRELSIETPIHGRILVEDAADPRGLLVVLHGYAERAEDALAEIQRVPGASGWQVAAVQGLHRFYRRSDEVVIASWMTRQDREQAIADNVAYIDRVLDALGAASSPVVFVGFSQGAAMAYRAAMLGRRRAAGVAALAGDIPPEIKAQPADRIWPPVLIGVGDRETWYTADKLESDIAFLESRGIPHTVVRFGGGHEWTPEFGDALGQWLADIPRSVTG